MADDPELQEIRRKRMAELQAQAGAKGGGGPSMGPGGAGGKEAAAKQQAAEDQRNMMLAQILSASARERLNRVAIVKPDVARMVGDRLIQLAQMGQIKSKVEEETIIQLLEQVQQQSQKTTIKFQRRRTDDDDDDDM